MLSFYRARQLQKSHSQFQFSTLNNTQNIIENHDYKSLSYWNTLIRAHATRNSPGDALRAFLAMRAEGIRPDHFMYPFLFKACSRISGLRQGKQMHADVIKHGFHADIYINNTLIYFYGSVKKLNAACKVFDEMPVKDIVAWNSIVAACVENSRSCDCIGIFCRMRELGFEPNETTMVGLLSASAEMGNLMFGKWVHSQVTVTGLFVNCELGTSLINMYAKCGDIHSARNIFDIMMVKNVWTWSAMILGLAQHGFALKALELFEEMKKCEIKPNYVTFLGILCACSHALLVEDGIRFFRQMQYNHGIKPMLVHYGAMLDCLSRSGRLIEGYNFIKNMKIKPDAVLWRTLYTACHIHDVNDYTGVSEKVKDELLKLQPSRCGNYVILANKYAEIGMWEKAEDLRRNITDKKMAGESCVQVGKSVCRFVSGKGCEDSYQGIYELIGILSLHMKIVNDDSLLSLC